MILLKLGRMTSTRLLLSTSLKLRLAIILSMADHPKTKSVSCNSSGYCRTFEIAYRSDPPKQEANPQFDGVARYLIHICLLILPLTRDVSSKFECLAFLLMQSAAGRRNIGKSLSIK